MQRFVLELHEIDRTHAALVGGKGAHLGELSHLDGVRIPAGFCITTHAFERALDEVPAIGEMVVRLAKLVPDDRAEVAALGAALRAAIEGLVIPHQVMEAIVAALARLGDGTPCAVRSSATAEDSPTASFAGQHDSLLPVVGIEAIREAVRRCWGSLFTERAIAYRLRHDVDPRCARMAVVVQRMVDARASGVVFTADPVSGNRRVVRIEAVPGLGEARLSGREIADRFDVRDDTMVMRAIAAGREAAPTLTDSEVTALAALARRIASHLGAPQDIEWCLTSDGFHVVQSRPITTLFPVPTADAARRIYVSVGHQQMMTDAMKPLGLSVWQMITPRPMAEAGGRLFVDVTQALAAPAMRAGLLAMFGRSDPRVVDALQMVLDRGDFIPSAPGDTPAVPPATEAAVEMATDLTIVERLMARTRASVAALGHDIADKSGLELLDFIRADIQELKRILFDETSHQVVMAGMEATWWLDDRMDEWLGEPNAAHILSQSVPHNVTSEMGLALLDVADAIRPHPAVVAYLERGEGDDFMDILPALNGGNAALASIVQWLDAYGMRGVGEIDITRTRWRDRPSMIFPLLLSHVRNAEPGSARKRVEHGVQTARRKEHELLERLRDLPDGARKADETKRMIDRLRTFIGYREYPKFGMVCRTFVYRRALLEEGERLMQRGVLGEPDDIYWLRFEELEAVVRAQRVDPRLVRERKEEFRSHEALVPPRVLTSEGECFSGLRRGGDLPDEALPGLPVSSGVVEGRARVILDIARAVLEPGDILVTAYTDPSWTPLFVAAAGVVTEVGGVMTHGAVIAREYGVPAVVGVEHATRRIRDGARIRVDGTRGYVVVVS